MAQDSADYWSARVTEPHIVVVPVPSIGTTAFACRFSPIADISCKLTARPRDPNLYFALGAAHHMRGPLGDAVRVWSRGAKVQAEPHQEAGLSTDTRYLGTMFTRMIGHRVYFDTFAKRKIPGLAPKSISCSPIKPISVMPLVLNAGATISKSSAIRR